MRNQEELYYDSDTSMTLLSGAPFDDPTWWLLSNEDIVKARNVINDFAGSRRMLAHTVITPKQPGWTEEVDKAIAVYKPDSWKSYTIGDPLSPSKYPWRLDDETLMYPFYEKAVKAGITTICIHKGLLPPDYENSYKGVWEYATCWDIGKAAKDWPQMNFVVYHSALRPFLELPDQAWAEFEASGRIKWASDLAEIPEKFGVTNVYGELGTSFANSAVAHPKFSAAFIGTLVKGLGADHVVWGSDTLWYGSPQWQIEAMRRLEIPEDMRKKYGFAALGGPSSATKQLIFGGNSARLYSLNLKAAENKPMPAYSEDRLAKVKAEYELWTNHVRSASIPPADIACIRRDPKGPLWHWLDSFKSTAKSRRGLSTIRSVLRVPLTIAHYRANSKVYMTKTRLNPSSTPAISSVNRRGYEDV
jgi:uncharacterized protein